MRRSSRGWLLTLCLWAAIAAGCGRSGPEIEESGPRNLIVIVSDALRADHLGCYGYDRDTSPNIDRLASEGVLFENSMSASSFTPESVASIFQGLYPSANGHIGTFSRPTTRTMTLLECFQLEGWRTGIVSETSWVTHDTEFLRGTDTFVKEIRPNVDNNSPNVTKAALEFVRANRLAMYLHYIDPHGEYHPSDDARGHFPEFDPNPSVDLYSDVRPQFNRLVENAFAAGHPQFEDLVARYDAEIRDMDAAVGELVSGLEAEGVLGDTVIVFTADHGEEFLEHDYVEHAWSLNQESVHVPLIVWNAKQFAPARHAERVSSVDLYPTLLTLFGLQAPEEDTNGKALFARSAEGWKFQPGEGPWFAELHLQKRNLLRCVVDGGWKLISARRWVDIPDRQEIEQGKGRPETNFSGEFAAESIDRWAPPVFEQLYNLADDPMEQNNLLAEGAELNDEAQRRLDDLRKILIGYQEYCQERHKGGIVEKQMEMTAEKREWMRKLGYL